MDFKKLLCEYGLSQAKFSRMTGIPIRTIEEWCGERRNPSDWTVNLIRFFLDHRDDDSPKK